MIFGGVGWCDIHVMDARQSVNWPPYIEDDDYFREGGASNHSFLDPGNLEDESIHFRSVQNELT